MPVDTAHLDSPPGEAPPLQDEIRRYYGQTLRSSGDLRTGACCTPESLSPELRTLLADIHPEVRDRFYGCGAPLPALLEGATVLDLGCGSGRDCYLLSRLVGPMGRVIGVDMTPEQLDVARAHRDWHARRYGHPSSNVEFLEGYIEDLASLGLADASVDVVVSNCVFNLSPDKPRLLAEVFRVLRPRGELLFADVFADRRIPDRLRGDPLLAGECLAGALYVEDFRRILTGVGCLDARQVASSPVELHDPDIDLQIGMITFTSRTFRAFRLSLEDRCEDYGQIATYRGTLPGHPHRFPLDDHHLLDTGRPLRVCGNTAAMLQETRYAPHFEVAGDRSTHFGLFDCGPAAAATGVSSTAPPCC